MSLLAKALLTVAMTVNPGGNSAYGGESVTVVESMVECRQTMRLFQYSKSRFGDIISVRNGNDILSFTVNPGWSESNTHYKLTCTSFEELQ